MLHRHHVPAVPAPNGWAGGHAAGGYSAPAQTSTLTNPYFPTQSPVSQLGSHLPSAPIHPTPPPRPSMVPAPSANPTPTWSRNYGASPPRPQPDRKAQSFADKSKGGYSSPYDLPTDILQPRKRVGAHTLQQRDVHVSGGSPLVQGGTTLHRSASAFAPYGQPLAAANISPSKIEPFGLCAGGHAATSLPAGQEGEFLRGSSPSDEATSSLTQQSHVVLSTTGADGSASAAHDSTAAGSAPGQHSSRRFVGSGGASPGESLRRNGLLHNNAWPGAFKRSVHALSRRRVSGQRPWASGQQTPATCLHRQQRDRHCRHTRPRRQGQLLRSTMPISHGPQVRLHSSRSRTTGRGRTYPTRRSLGCSNDVRPAPSRGCHLFPRLRKRARLRRKGFPGIPRPHIWLRRPTSIQAISLRGRGTRLPLFPPRMVHTLCLRPSVWRHTTTVLLRRASCHHLARRLSRLVRCTVTTVARSSPIPSHDPHPSAIPHRLGWPRIPVRRLFLSTPPLPARPRLSVGLGNTPRVSISSHPPTGESTTRFSGGEALPLSHGGLAGRS